jgi:hypothetical protein
MKRTKEEAADAGVIFSSANRNELHPSLLQHLDSQDAQSARYRRGDDGGYVYRFAGRPVNLTGLISWIEYKFHPKFDKKKARRTKSTTIRGSWSAQGKEVDQQVALACAGPLFERHPMTAKLLNYFAELGHTLQAGQVPVKLPKLERMTQADLITRDRFGFLWLWEIKTGKPVALNQKQGTFVGPLKDVPASKFNIWHLQLRFTRLALEGSGVEIAQARIIQVYEQRKSRQLKIKVFEQPQWTRKLAF